jgi:hypothetical protein
MSPVICYRSTRGKLEEIQTETKDERLLYGVADLAFSSTYFLHGVLEESLTGKLLRISVVFFNKISSFSARYGFRASKQYVESI